MTRGEQAVSELKRRSEREAAAIISRYGLSYDDLTLAAVAVGWLEGRQAGGEEARDIILDALVRISAPEAVSVLHSVKVTP